jgi:hypothetical protein
MTKNLKMLMTKLWNQAHKENRRRDRAKKCYTAPKPCSSTEKLARADKASVRRNEIKLYNAEKAKEYEKTLAGIIVAVLERTKRNVIIQKIKDIDTRRSVINEILLRHKISSYADKKLSFGAKPMADYRLKLVLSRTYSKTA